MLDIFFKTSRRCNHFDVLDDRSKILFIFDYVDPYICRLTAARMDYRQNSSFTAETVTNSCRAIDKHSHHLIVAITTFINLFKVAQNSFLFFSDF